MKGIKKTSSNVIKLISERELSEIRRSGLMEGLDGSGLCRTGQYLMGQDRKEGVD